jgi:hypothetical protein
MIQVEYRSSRASWRDNEVSQFDEWEFGKQFMSCNASDVIAIRADGTELERILWLFSGIAKPNYECKGSTIAWFGDDAKFIFYNFILGVANDIAEEFKK